MFSPVTGLSALGAGRPPLPNSISHVNAVGLKATRTSYEDLRNYLSGGEARPKAAGQGFMIKDVNQ